MSAIDTLNNLKNRATDQGHKLYDKAAQRISTHLETAQQLTNKAVHRIEDTYHSAADKAGQVSNNFAHSIEDRFQSASQYEANLESQLSKLVADGSDTFEKSIAPKAEQFGQGLLKAGRQAGGFAVDVASEAGSAAKFVGGVASEVGGTVAEKGWAASSAVVSGAGNMLGQGIGAVGETVSNHSGKILVGGLVVAGAVAIAASGGTATPLVAGAAAELGVAGTAVAETAMVAEAGTALVSGAGVATEIAGAEMVGGEFAMSQAGRQFLLRGCRF
jgi:hypothetical protein